MPDLFQGRRVLIASRHQKEQVMRPLLESKLHLEAVVIPDLDTDRFGTFAGEVERTDTALETARKKCRWAMEHSGFDLAIASEGSFGPHPAAFFLPSDEEWVILIDRKHNLELVARVLSLETNFQQAKCNTFEELRQWAEKVQFPTHAIILSSPNESRSEIVKGIHNPDRLWEIGKNILHQYGHVCAQTDMRAMHNPTRMKVIEAATQSLVQKALSLCPSCQWPGFDITHHQQGLPCAWCGTPTNEVMYTISACHQCGHELLNYPPDNSAAADPGHCNVCNP